MWASVVVTFRNTLCSTSLLSLLLTRFMASATVLPCLLSLYCMHFFRVGLILAGVAVGSMLIKLHISVLLLTYQPGNSHGVSHTGRSSVHRVAC